MPTRRTPRKPVRRTRNPSGPVTPALIARIAKMTDENDHTGSILALAEALKMPRQAKALRAVEVLHDYHGHMPSGLRAERDGISKIVLAEAKKSTDAETYRRLYGAF